MAKGKIRRPTPIKRAPSPTQSARRLEGDDLMIWSMFQERARTLNQQMNDFVGAKREEGVIGPNEAPNGAGFIVPMQQGPMQMQMPPGAQPAASTARVTDEQG